MFLLDTNICVYFLKGLFPAIPEHFRRWRPSDVSLPAIVAAELWLGAEKSLQPTESRRLVDEFLKPFTVSAFDVTAARSYAAIRAALEKRGAIIGPNDLLIAATALAFHATLVTHNIKEFSRVPGLAIVDWTED